MQMARGRAVDTDTRWERAVDDEFEESNEKTVIRAKQADALRLLRAGDVDAALDGYDRLRLNADVDKLADSQLLTDFCSLVSSVDGLTGRQKAKAALFRESWAQALSDASRAAGGETVGNCAGEPESTPSSHPVDWRYSPASSLAGKPAQASLKGYGFEKYGVIVGTLELAGDGDVIIRPSEADGYPAGAYFPVGKVNDRGYLKKYDVVQSLDVWDAEPDGLHRKFEVVPLPEDEIMVGAAYDGEDNGDGDVTLAAVGPAASDVLDVDCDSGAAASPSGGMSAVEGQAGSSDAGLADLLRRHEHFESLPDSGEPADAGERGVDGEDRHGSDADGDDPQATSVDSSLVPASDAEIDHVISELSADPEVQDRLERLVAQADALTKRMSSTSAGLTRARADGDSEDAGSGVEAQTGRKPAPADADSPNARRGQTRPREETTASPVVWLASTRSPDGQMDCSQAEAIAGAMGRQLTTIDAGRCVDIWSPTPHDDGTCSIPSWVADALAGDAVLAVVGLDPDTGSVDQTAAVRLLADRTMAWGDGRSVRVPASTMLLVVMESSRIDAARRAVDSYRN